MKRFIFPPMAILAEICDWNRNALRPGARATQGLQRARDLAGLLHLRGRSGTNGLMGLFVGQTEGIHAYTSEQESRLHYRQRVDR